MPRHELSPSDDSALDTELVEQARGGSEAAFQELVERYERPVYSLVVRMVRDAAAAEDLCQEIFLKMWRHLDGYDPGRKFSSWLFKIAHNATIDRMRRRVIETEPLEDETAREEGRRPREHADPSAENPEQARERGELAAALDRAVGALRPAYREVMLLRFREGLAYEEIAEITGQPLGTVKTFIFRARREMMESLRRQGWGRDGSGGPLGAGSDGETGGPGLA